MHKTTSDTSAAKLFLAMYPDTLRMEKKCINCCDIPLAVKFTYKYNLSNFILDEESKETDEKSKEQPKHKFTDDTAMTRSVARSLIHNKGINVKDMAQK